MEPTPTRTERRAPSRKRPRVVFGAMAGAILLVAAACGGNNEPAATQDATSTTTSVATTTTTTTPVATTTTASSTTTTVAAVRSEDALAVVFSAIEARNRGDIVAYKASLAGAEAHVEAHNLSEALSYANDTMELSGCRVTGTTPSRMAIVECESTSTDDFYGTGGIVETGLTTFHVTEDGKISSIGCCGSDEDEDIPWEETELAMFTFAFWSWMMDAHPTVFDDVGPYLYDIPGLAAFVGDSRDPAEMLIAVEYVAEFVAQSDDYPINDTDS